jgi:integrating conjugative element protein (TIGR03746 family)
MLRYRSELDNLRAHIATLRAVCGLLAVLVIGAGWAWDRSRQTLRIILPPDLRAGAVLRADDIPPAAAYVFTYYLLQQLQRWPRDGQRDYPQALYQLASYMTPTFEGAVRADLDYKGRQGELTERTHALQEVPGSGYSRERVQVLGNGVWVVTLDVQIIETVRGTKVKDTYVRYPVRVVRYPIDPERNPWGLALGRAARALADAADRGVSRRSAQ